jgi:hypothetical protein
MSNIDRSRDKNIGKLQAAMRAVPKPENAITTGHTDDRATLIWEGDVWDEYQIRLLRSARKMSRYMAEKEFKDGHRERGYLIHVDDPEFFQEIRDGGGRWSICSMEIPHAVQCRHQDYKEKYGRPADTKFKSIESSDNE